MDEKLEAGHRPAPAAMTSKQAQQQITDTNSTTEKESLRPEPSQDALLGDDEDWEIVPEGMQNGGTRPKEHGSNYTMQFDIAVGFGKNKKTMYSYDWNPEMRKQLDAAEEGAKHGQGLRDKSEKSEVRRRGDAVFGPAGNTDGHSNVPRDD